MQKSVKDFSLVTKERGGGGRRHSQVWWTFRRPHCSCCCHKSVLLLQTRSHANTHTLNSPNPLAGCLSLLTSLWNGQRRTDTWET